MSPPNELSSSSSGVSPSDLHASLSNMFTGVESPLNGLNGTTNGNSNNDETHTSSSSSSGPRDPAKHPEDTDYTPFPSPQMAKMDLNDEDAISEADMEALSDTSSEGGVIDDSHMPTEDEIKEAEELKKEGNAAFSAQEYPKAIALFTRAIRTNPQVSVYWGNRAMARMKLEEYGGAILDCSKAIELDEGNVKAYYRRALSRLAILRPTLAVPDFKTVLRLDPRNKLAREQLETTVKLIRRIEFEKAISVGETETASSKCLAMITSDSVPIEPGYEGPLPPYNAETKRYEPSKKFVAEMVEHFKNGGKIPKRLCWEIVLGCKEVLDKEESLVEVTVPKGVTSEIVGDTHGQFYDLCNLLDMIKPPSDDHIIVFNGDFVDRGSWSVEVVLTLFAYKWTYPQRIFLNRGNHETSDMNKVYGFEGECKAKHGEMTYKLFADVFTSRELPHSPCVFFSSFLLLLSYLCTSLTYTYTFTSSQQFPWPPSSKPPNPHQASSRKVANLPS